MDAAPETSAKKDSAKKLVVTNLWNRGLTSIPKQLLSLNSIQWLNISHNRLSSIPNELCISLTNLEHLFVSFNQLTNLPMDIRFLHHLKELVLDHNSITSVPKELFWCTNLTHLYLPFNQLYWLPKDIANLSKLKVLSLSFNNLVTLPSELSKLEHLTELHIRNNPFEPLVLEELAPHTPRKTKDVLEYLASELPPKSETTKENGNDASEDEEEEEDSDDENELLEWLRLFQLQDLYNPLQEVGVEEIEDLHFLGENDLDHIEPVDLRDKLLNRIYKDNAYANNNKYSLYQ